MLANEDFSLNIDCKSTSSNHIDFPKCTNVYYDPTIDHLFMCQH